jgi:RNA polymerase sigma factor (sigma-70 family)|tara:strand:- start:1130 stop:1714 length:585 start_codon:yes stop_codon:yes gene_type:complete
VRRNKQDLDREIEGIILEISAAENPAEFTQLYQDTSDELRRLLVRKMGNKEEAEEIAQDAYLKLCRLKHNRDIGNLRSYLFNMAVRLAINVLRKREADGRQDYLQPTEEDGPSAYKILVDELKAETIKDALTHLSEKTRYIFLLHRFEGLSYSAIAKRLTVSDSSVEDHINRALDKIMLATAEFRRMEGQGYGH